MFPVFVASAGIGRWVDVSNDRFCYLYRIAGKWYSLAIFACFLFLTRPIFCSLLALWYDACVPILNCMFTWQPWYSHTSTSYLTCWLFTLLALWVLLACLGVVCGLSHTLMMLSWYSLINEDLLCGWTYIIKIRHRWEASYGNLFR